jgi:BirA family biotin operon repressor/biotin-[acetyl-CoA-carboxylase] ligase
MNTEKNPYESIGAGLETSIIGQKIIYFPSLPSTMDAARREARRGAAESTVIIAGEQTRGRGRMQRTWFSTSGNIALSIILYPAAASLPYLIMIASLAAARSIESVTGLKAQIKWPNDILIGGKKVCGILIENEVKGDKVAYSIVGIGINVGLRPADYTGIEVTATALEKEAGREVSKADIVSRLLVEFERLYLALPAGESIYEAWRDKLVTLGRMVTVKSGSDTLEGIAESVDGSGALWLRRADGTLTRVVAGDVTLSDNK